MTDSTAPATASDHNVSDPGVTLLQALVLPLGAVAVVAASVIVFRRGRRSGRAKVAEGLPIGAILDRLRVVVRPLLKRVLG